MKDKHIEAIIAFGLSACFAIFIIVSFIWGKAGWSDGVTVDEVFYSTVDEVSTDVSIPVIETETGVLDANMSVEATTASTKDEHNNYQSYSEYEYDLVARTIYQESGICGEYCQWLVGSTILNLADERGGIENVVFDYNTFNVAYVLYDCTPSELSYQVAARVLSGDRDYNVKYFRTDYYHGFGTPYTNVDNVYFSTN